MSRYDAAPVDGGVSYAHQLEEAEAKIDAAADELIRAERWSEVQGVLTALHRQEWRYYPDGQAWAMVLSRISWVLRHADYAPEDRLIQQVRVFLADDTPANLLRALAQVMDQDAG